MKEFIDKLISRLEEERDEYQETEHKFEEDYGGRVALDLAIRIVNQLAEEYGKDTNVTTNGWIPCSERLPEEYGFVLCYGKNREGENKYEVSTYAHEIHCWMCSRIADVIAWKPLPAPYTEGE